MPKHSKRRHRRGGKYRKGSRSKTRKGRQDFITHLGSAVYDEAGHFLRRAVKPYTRRRRRRRRRRRGGGKKGPRRGLNCVKKCTTNCRNKACGKKTGCCRWVKDCCY